jgi:hypothetical protein
VQSQHQVNEGREEVELGGVDDIKGKEKDLGLITEEGNLLKGSCSGWAQSNKFGPLNLMMQEEGGVFF